MTPQIFTPKGSQVMAAGAGLLDVTRQDVKEERDGVAETVSLIEDQAKSPLAKFIDLIWNTTLVCPWNCGNCCVDAVYVTNTPSGLIQIQGDGLSTTETLPKQDGCGSIYDQAAALRQRQGLELNFAGKLRVLDHLAGFRVKIDFSGGDVLSVSENFKLLEVASRRLGRESITLTATGAGLARYKADEVGPLISEFNFTFDGISPKGSKSRPPGYAVGNLRKAREFVDAGVRVRAECPLTTHNLDEQDLRTLYMKAHQAGIHKLLLMRLFPVGRGMFHPEDVPSPSQYRRAIAVLREMEAKFGRPELKLQCAMKFFDGQDLEENPCDLIRESFGLRPDGTLLASPWAVNGYGQPLDDTWVLGNLATTPMQEILATPKVREYERRLDENRGHCKIFAYLNSRKQNPADRLFDPADPLLQRQRRSVRLKTL